MASSIIYADEVYELTGVEYCELEDRLEALEGKDHEDAESGYEQIVYQFLADKGYDPPAPKEKSWLDNLKPKKSKSSGARGALERNAEAAEEERASPKGQMPVRGRGHRGVYNRRPIGRDEKADKAGGGCALIVIALCACAYILSTMSGAPVAINGKLTRPDGTVIETPAVPSPTPTPTPTPAKAVEAVDAPAKASKTAQPKAVPSPLSSPTPTPSPKKIAGRDGGSEYREQMRELMRQLERDSEPSLPNKRRAKPKVKAEEEIY